MPGSHPKQVKNLALFCYAECMPAKNIVKQFTEHSYYHVYNRGVAKQNIFIDQADKRYFLALIDRHLNPQNSKVNKIGMPYRKFDATLELLCYCLMGNHFHFLFHMGESRTAITDFMRSISTAYTMYFNLKYKRVGPLFQGAYKASLITSDPYLLHISRYIHLNPREYNTYKYSSYQDYLNNPRTNWLKPEKILALFEGSNYGSFVRDHEDHKAMLDEIKNELANH